MPTVLRQATAVDVLIGPFLDQTDGFTAETGESPAVKLSKNGQSLAAKSDATTPLHDADGYYNCELDATDTNTVGTLVLTVAASANALPVRHEFQVVEEQTYDFLYASAANPNAAINAEVVDVMTVDTHAELGQLSPPATATKLQMMQLSYKIARNMKEQDATELRLYNDAGSVVDQKSSLSNVAGVTTRGELVSGP